VPINVLDAKHVADLNESFDISDPEVFVGRAKQVVGVGFRPEDSAFRAEFNKALKDYMGSDEMMATVTPDEYIKAFLPGAMTMEDACKSNWSRVRAGRELGKKPGSAFVLGVVQQSFWRPLLFNLAIKEQADPV